MKTFTMTSPEYFARGSDSDFAIVPTGETMSYEESDAIEELRVFLDLVSANYRENGYDGRANCVDDFSKRVAFVDHQMFLTAAKAYAFELATVIQDGGRPQVVHGSHHDTKDRFVGSGEYIFAHVAHVLRQDHGFRVGSHYDFAPPRDLNGRTEDDTYPIYVFDDWIITGGQMRHTIADIGKKAAGNTHIRLLATREESQAVREIAPEVNSIRYEYPFEGVDDIARGPSIIGAHSSVNIGWQNMLATFALDLSYMRGGQDVRLPGLGYIKRPYRTRLDTPRYYKCLPQSSLLSYAFQTGADPSSFPSSKLETLTDQFTCHDVKPKS